MRIIDESVFNGLPRTLKAVIASLLLGGFNSSQAQLTVTIPAVGLEGNLAGQVVQVFVSNGGPAQQVTGVDLNLQVGDGGTAAGGSTNGPAITSVDLVTGTIFQFNNNGPSGSGQIVPQIFERGTLTVSDTINIPSGGPWLLAAVTLDTTGFASGTWTIKLNTLNGTTRFTTTGADLVPAFEATTVTIVPTMKLAISRLGKRIFLNWSSAFTNDSLQAKETLTPAIQWLTATNPAIAENGYFSVMLELAPGNHFFRLISESQK